MISKRISRNLDTAQASGHAHEPGPCPTADADADRRSHTAPPKCSRDSPSVDVSRVAMSIMGCFYSASPSSPLLPGVRPGARDFRPGNFACKGTFWLPRSHILRSCHGQVGGSIIENVHILFYFIAKLKRSRRADTDCPSIFIFDRQKYFFQKMQL